jgi:ribosomal protein S18 acetylase RimI-like enzyme
MGAVESVAWQVLSWHGDLLLREVRLSVAAIEPYLFAQAEHFASVDPMLAERPHQRPGELITARTRDGDEVAGVLSHERHGPGSLPSLWSAREVWTLYPLLAAPVADGLHALIDEWAGVLHDAGRPGEDTSCVLSWPSRDVGATQALLSHGLVPLTVLAVRTGAQPAPRTSPRVRIRRAEPADLPALVRLAMTELAYSAQVGGAIMRPDAEAMKRTALNYRLGSGAPIWLAEQDGACVGMVECVRNDVQDTEEAYLRAGMWNYLNCLSVLPEARGGGIGDALVDVAHRQLPRRAGWYLYYNPINPLSSVFWPRHGYRPLWTIWEARPASALR